MVVQRLEEGHRPGPRLAGVRWPARGLLGAAKLVQGLGLSQPFTASLANAQRPGEMVERLIDPACFEEQLTQVVPGVAFAARVTHAR